MDVEFFEESDNDFVTCLGFSRYAGQSFKIGKDITVQIYKVEGKRVGIKVYAPKSVKVMRSELLDNSIR